MLRMKPLAKNYVVLGAAAMLCFAAPAVADDVADGAAIFKQMCSACHVVTPNAKPGIGPTLFGVVGRPVGSVPNFKYSKPLTADKAAGVKWTKDSLATYIAAPQKAKPGTAMVIAVKDETKRNKLMAYLATLK